MFYRTFFKAACLENGPLYEDVPVNCRGDLGVELWVGMTACHACLGGGGVVGVTFQSVWHRLASQHGCHGLSVECKDVLTTGI